VTAATPLTWDGFTDLPGDPKVNFELLWRSAVYRNYAQYGKFTARVQQAGVEFHLEIDKPNCPLGAIGRVFGWQTKWFGNLAPGKALSQTRKNQITSSINKTRKHWPNITDWVLVTKHPLTDGDQTWFTGLSPGMALHQASLTELSDLLTGDALSLRQAYFGELVLTPERLSSEHSRMTAAIKDRWIPEVHQSSDGEYAVRRMLAQPDAWQDLADIDADIARFSKAVRAAVPGLDPANAADVTSLLTAAADVRSVLDDIYKMFSGGDAARLLGAGSRSIPPLPVANPTVLRKLKALAHPTAPALANLISFMREAVDLIEQVGRSVDTPLVVISGGAGFGKTQLAATLSAPTPQIHFDDLPAGVFMEGRLLGKRHTLDDFARQFRISSTPLSSFDDLLAATDAAASRAGARLPIVIDGLNEAEAPREWLPLLRQLLTLMGNYRNVLVVCTVRDTFVAEAIPPDVPAVHELGGFHEDLDEAIGQYFAHYKIEAGDAELPLERLTHPLTLRIYCEVANPTREEWVNAESLPGSLTGMFDAYLAHLASRVAQLSETLHEMDVIDGVLSLGAELWTAGARLISDGRARALLGDTGRRWEETLLSALESEGFLIRYPNGPGTDVGIVYDLLAGHVVARSLIASHGAALKTVMSDPDTLDRFVTPEKAHPLASDIFEGLAGGLPRAASGQLWKMVPDPLRLPALLAATSLEAPYLDSATVAALEEAADDLRGRHDLFDQLLAVRAVPDHPLNAMFVDALLRHRSVAGRDLRWTEWLRSRYVRIRADTSALGKRWQAQPDRTPADRLRARWLMWTLTSTDRPLRDAATAALFWFGCHDPEGLFDLAKDSAAINDPYVLERMVAASYGVTTTRQVHDQEFEPVLARFLQNLADLFTGPAPAAPTSHALTRYYASSVFAFADRFYPSSLPSGLALPPVFSPAPAVDPLPVRDPRRDEVDHTVRMDFGNYTIGRLFHDRRNYDDQHAGHIEAVAHVLGVTYALGYRDELFRETERSIDETSRFPDRGKVDRYGKKYGWIGLQTHAALLADRGTPPDHLEVDIDPSFPQQPPPLGLTLPTWARSTPVDEKRWLRAGVVKVPADLVEVSELEGEVGPWLLTHAFLEAKDVTTGRRTFGLFNTVLVDVADVARLVAHLTTVVHPGRDLIDIPAAYYSFAGEIPWNDRFAAPEPGHPPQSVYEGVLRLPGGDLDFEIVSHDFSWESYHSPLNDANGYTPGKLISAAADLRALPHGFDQAEPGGRLAARAFSAPAGFDGNLLYQRLDVLKAYAAGRAIVTFGWGERNTQFAWPDQIEPTIQKVYQEGRNVWREHWVR
jgi:hypothetical protein